jgi:hypothetical protein
VFRRSSKSDTPAPETVDKGPGAKGRPTPTRKEAEAAARQRAKGATDKKAAQRLQRERRAEQNAQIREGMKTGNERYLPARDKGPVKRFIRDFVDARLTVVEFLLPLLLVIWVLQAFGTPAMKAFSSALWTTSILVVAVDLIWLMVRLRRAIAKELPGESTRGTTTYTLMRVVQIRPLRQPKPRVRIGGKPK